MSEPKNITDNISEKLKKPTIILTIKYFKTKNGIMAKLYGFPYKVSGEGKDEVEAEEKMWKELDVQMKKASGDWVKNIKEEWGSIEGVDYHIEHITLKAKYPFRMTLIDN